MTGAGRQPHMWAVWSGEDGGIAATATAVRAECRLSVPAAISSEVLSEVLSEIVPTQIVPQIVFFIKTIRMTKSSIFIFYFKFLNYFSHNGGTIHALWRSNSS